MQSAWADCRYSVTGHLHLTAPMCIMSTDIPLDNEKQREFILIILICLTFVQRQLINVCSLPMGHRWVIKSFSLQTWGRSPARSNVHWSSECLPRIFQAFFYHWHILWFRLELQVTGQWIILIGDGGSRSILCSRWPTQKDSISFDDHSRSDHITSCVLLNQQNEFLSF